MLEDLTPYERERAAVIAANRARLASLGLADAARALGVAPAPARPKPRPKRPPPSRPTRASKRLRGERAPGDEGGVKSGSPPRSRSPSRSPPPKWTDAELKELAASREAARVAAMDARLGELSAAGLIDVTHNSGGGAGGDAPATAAQFAVVGAPHKGKKRKHYVVTLTARPYGCACECLDWRFRHKSTDHYACKHVRLIHTALGCAGAPEGWEAALEASVVRGGGGRVKEEKG